MSHQTIEDIHKKNYNLSRLELWFGIQLMCIKKMEKSLIESLKKDILNSSDEITCNIFFWTLWAYELMRILKNKISTEWQLKIDKFNIIPKKIEQINIVFNREEYDLIIKTYKLLHRLRIPFAKIEKEYAEEKGFSNDWLFIDDFDNKTKDCFFDDNSWKWKISIKKTIKSFNDTLNIFNKHLSLI